MNKTQELLKLASRKQVADALPVEQRAAHKDAYDELCRRMRVYMVDILIQAVAAGQRPYNQQVQATGLIAADAIVELDVERFMDSLAGFRPVDQDPLRRMGFTDDYSPTPFHNENQARQRPQEDSGGHSVMMRHSRRRLRG